VALLIAGARLGAVAATRIALGSAVVAVGLLAVAGAAPGLIFAFALVQGAANGVASILRPVVTAELLGREGFGAISGAIAVAPLAGAALAPVLGAWLIEVGGMSALIAACAAFSLLSALAAAGLRRDLWR
jgi:MFS family permease